MKRCELIEYISKEGVPDDILSLDGDFGCDDCFVVSKENGLCVVYYLEKGSRTELYSSSSCDCVYEYIYNEIKNEVRLGVGEFHLNDKDLIELISDKDERKRQEKIKKNVLSQIKRDTEDNGGDLG